MCTGSFLGLKHTDSHFVCSTFCFLCIVQPQFGQNTMGGGAGKMGMQQQQKAQMNMMFGMGAPMIGT